MGGGRLAKYKQLVDQLARTRDWGPKYVHFCVLHKMGYHPVSLSDYSHFLGTTYVITYIHTCHYDSTPQAM